MRQTEASIEDRVKNVLLGMVKDRLMPEELLRETPLGKGGLGLDSVRMFELVTNLEAEFDVFFEGTELSAEVFRNIGSLADYISQKL